MLRSWKLHPTPIIILNQLSLLIISVLFEKLLWPPSCLPPHWCWGVWCPWLLFLSVQDSKLFSVLSLLISHSPLTVLVRKKCSGYQAGPMSISNAWLCSPLLRPGWKDIWNDPRPFQWHLKTLISLVWRHLIGVFFSCSTTILPQEAWQPPGAPFSPWLLLARLTFKKDLVIGLLLQGLYSGSSPQIIYSPEAWNAGSDNCLECWSLTVVVETDWASNRAAWDHGTKVRPSAPTHHMTAISSQHLPCPFNSSLPRSPVSVTRKFFLSHTKHKPVCPPCPVFRSSSNHSESRHVAQLGVGAALL